RAYLKLWEALTLLGDCPRPGQRCIDMGSSPGGWTWVLAQLGANVVSVDKAPLDDRVRARATVEYRQVSAFALPPEPIDWFFSDVICYPRRLLAMVERWLSTGARFVCTIKLQGLSEPDVLARFAALPDARIRHLFHNRHELTLFIHPSVDAAPGL
ncbi:MAG: SAM-dependent methyltransferase, partial [Myxococcota bacterium]